MLPGLPKDIIHRILLFAEVNPSVLLLKDYDKGYECAINALGVNVFFAPVLSFEFVQQPALSEVGSYITVFPLISILTFQIGFVIVSRKLFWRRSNQPPSFDGHLSLHGTMFHTGRAR